MAVTDDERRNVAARLRHEARTCIHSVLISPDDALRLADLIDPGESGQNLDTNRDSVQKESLAVQKAPECDREALLAEAKEAEKSAWYFALDHDEDELRDRLTEAAEEFSDMARRIREACGEVAG